MHIGACRAGLNRSGKNMGAPAGNREAAPGSANRPDIRR